MPWKVDDAGALMMKDGLPVFQFPNGTEEGVDFDKGYKKINDLNNENKLAREAREEAEKKMAEYDAVFGEGGANLDAIKKSMEITKLLDEEKLIAADKAQKLRDDAIADMKTQLLAKDAEVGAAKKEIDELVIRHAFAGSELVKNKLLLPFDWAARNLGENFKNEKGVAVGYHNGNPIRSQKNLGDVADFDEALAVLIDLHPQKDKIYRADAGGGSGAEAATAATNGGKSVLLRSQFDDLAPALQAKHVSTGGIVIDGPT
jgi:hypothetical protein